MGEISTFGLELFSSSQIFYKGRATHFCPTMKM